LSLALIPWYDVVGAAVATSLGAVATHVLLTFLSRRRLGFAGAAWWRQAGTRSRGSSHE
jgi:peptidoglycan biosynthesis protein MviN/MurJ (putative lipid II flippase)